MIEWLVVSGGIFEPARLGLCIVDIVCQRSVGGHGLIVVGDSWEDFSE